MGVQGEHIQPSTDFKPCVSFSIYKTVLLGRFHVRPVIRIGWDRAGKLLVQSLPHWKCSPHRCCHYNCHHHCPHFTVEGMRLSSSLVVIPRMAEPDSLIPEPVCHAYSRCSIDAPWQQPEIRGHIPSHGAMWSLWAGRRRNLGGLDLGPVTAWAFSTSTPQAGSLLS